MGIRLPHLIPAPPSTLSAPIVIYNGGMMQPANYIAGFPTHPRFSDSGSGQEEQPALLVAYQDRVIQLTPDPPPPASCLC